jgi:enolase-phosphatase E1
VIAARAIVTDVEGTTSAIAFVKDVLFPYAGAHLDAYVADHRHDAAVAQAVHDAAVAAHEPGASDARVLEHLHAWMRADRKLTPLKTLQGLIWAEGYARGDLLGHVYADVPPALRAWHAAGVALYVYSSGSIQAQQVLFAHTFAGDLRSLFAGHFDTTIGAKREPASYAAIAAQTRIAPAKLLFLSDIEEELDAAQAAGLQTARLLRPDDTPPGATTRHPAFADFAALSSVVVVG